MIKLADEAPKKKITPNDMYDGQVGVIVGGDDDYKGLIVMKVYGNLLICLNGVHTWESDNLGNIDVDILPNGTKLEITINERESKCC